MSLWNWRSPPAVQILIQIRQPRMTEAEIEAFGNHPSIVEARAALFDSALSAKDFAGPSLAR